MIESWLDPDLANQNIPSLFRMENRTPHRKSALESGNLAWQVGQWVKCRCRSVRIRVQSPAHTRVSAEHSAVCLQFQLWKSGNRRPLWLTDDQCQPNQQVPGPSASLVSETKWTTPEESYQRRTSGLYLPCTRVHVHVPRHIRKLKFLSHSWRLRTMR